MPATDRLVSERLFHDAQARQRAAWFAHRSEQFRFSDDAYLDHESWIRPAFEQLDDVRGLRVLDFGCGHGMAAVVLARRGARVTAFDLSGGYVAEARTRAAANGVAIDLVQADGECLPFADAAFDRIWGNAVLHHLDMTIAAAELCRVLRPNGWAVFCEPWGENPLLRWARRRLAYAGKHQTADEEPLRRQHIAQLRMVFPAVEVCGHQFLAMAGRVLRGRRIAGLNWCDAQLLKRVPALQNYCRYVVLTLRR
jgi:2-polyprenyl-3-methyl-5-hydroxy-6-metoxy-1,4-benzoquinol methylase